MNITFTGIDPFTDLSLLPKDVEYGILYTETFSPNSSFSNNRYPSLIQIENMSNYLFSNNIRLSLHVCGKSARTKLINKELPFINNFNRIQINGFLSVDEIELICSLYPLHTIITQHNFKNTPLLAVSSSNHSILIDASGGLGLSPEEWISPITDKLVGFAGGLSPDNIFSEFEKIKLVSKSGFWLDLEGKLRNKNDFFDVNLAIDMANKFNILKNLKF